MTAPGWSFYTGNDRRPGDHTVHERKGLWDKGERSGNGIETKANGDMYDGEWAKDKKEGNGMMKWAATGEYYIGEWMDDNQAGRGEMTGHPGSAKARHNHPGEQRKGPIRGKRPGGTRGLDLQQRAGELRQGTTSSRARGPRDQPDPGRPNAVLRENDLVTYCPWKPDGPYLLPVFHGKGASINLRTGEVTKFNYVDGMWQKRGGGGGGGATPPQRRESSLRERNCTDSQSTKELEERQVALQIHVSGEDSFTTNLCPPPEKVALQAQLQQGSPHPNNELVMLASSKKTVSFTFYPPIDLYGTDLNHIVDHIQGCKWASSAKDASERMHIDIACERLSPFTVPICMHCPLHKVVELEVRKMYGNKDIKVIVKGEVELNLDHIVSIAVGIATGMNYLHRQRIIHKNLHSNNILFDDHGTPKICDSELPTANKVVSLAEVQVPYLPPQMYTHTSNERSDVWQFGVLFSEMMQGEVPHVELTAAHAPEYLSQQKTLLRASEMQEIDQLHAQGVDQVTVALCLARRNACMEIVRTSAGQYVDQMPTAASLVPPLVNMCLYLPGIVNCRLPP
ncbi:Protein tyrosine and serine/threonine kinase [Pelomyxa schiedti]|nr:Protein tyrosine and serine/threonine kinase [Pelomyxa schiedti]